MAQYVGRYVLLDPNRFGSITHDPVELACCAGLRVTVRLVLDGGHQRFRTIRVRCSELTLCASKRTLAVQEAL
jgi:hypothetical protein